MPEVLLPPSFNILHRRVEAVSQQVSNLSAMIVALTAKVDDLKPKVEQTERGHAPQEENLTYPRRRGRPPKNRNPES